MNKTTQGLIAGAVALAIGLLLGWAVRGVSTYSSNSETVTSFSDWRTACPPASLKDQKCQMMQDVLDSKSQSSVARITITRDKGQQILGLTLPLGVALAPGVGLVLGTDPVKVFAYRTCTQIGCIAELPLDDKLMASFASAKDGRILVAGQDGKPVAIPVSLKGYPEAAHAYRSSEAKRANWFWRMWS